MAKMRLTNLLHYNFSVRLHHFWTITVMTGIGFDRALGLFLGLCLRALGFSDSWSQFKVSSDKG